MWRLHVLLLPLVKMHLWLFSLIYLPSSPSSSPLPTLPYLLSSSLPPSPFSPSHLLLPLLILSPPTPSSLNQGQSFTSASMLKKEGVRKGHFFWSKDVHNVFHQSLLRPPPPPPTHPKSHISVIRIFFKLQNSYSYNCEIVFSFTYCSRFMNARLL